MQLKFSLEAIFRNLCIFLGLTFPPCFCRTGKYNSPFQFLVFHVSGAVSSKPFVVLHVLPGDQSKDLNANTPDLIQNVTIYGIQETSNVELQRSYKTYHCSTDY